MNHIFAEPRPGEITHTALSRLLRTDSNAFDAIGMVLEELIPASQHIMPAIARYPGTGEPNETAYNIANDTALPMFQFLAQHPERARRFGAGMKFFTQGGGYDLRHLIAGYNWESLDRPGAVLVDVGGGHGAVSQGLASVTANLRFIVQDLEGTVKTGALLLPRKLTARVDFMPHDFFAGQSVRADVYFFRWIFHNWSDKYSVQILQNLRPAMDKGAKVIIYEYVLSEESKTEWTEKLGR